MAQGMPLSEDVLRQYIGGSGLGAWLLLAEGGATTEPLSPEAPLIFAFSPLVGSPLTTSAKFAVVSRSPLTGRFNDSLASSGFAIAGKQAGCDAIVLVGKAAKLSVLVIDDGNVRLEPADDVAGDSCPVTEEKLRARLGTNYRIASIGAGG
jgi:aldehyde:ferredoxin oxidoreductase